MEIEIAIVGGVLSAIHSEEVAPLLQEGDGFIARASHVEPNERNEWLADMSPVGGPMLGPYATRQAALAAEVEYLKAEYL